MIKINFIPKHLRKEKKVSLWGQADIPIEIVVGVIGALAIFLLALHLFFLGMNTARFLSYKNIQNKLHKIESAKKEVETLLEEKKNLDEQIQRIKELVGVRAVLWSQMLNMVSDHLSKGVWLTDVSLTEKGFLIKGSAVSRQDTKVTNIHHFLSNLKNDTIFNNHFLNLELSSVQRRMVRNIEVADFVITAQFYKK
ncbi:MAG TPA: PilN domain-containing protein [Candidatus Omnitrophota bacterium]|nr:PilN domain-containing protein [Candidatus Omnitrophota bacterium]HPN89100.1 PilN domain-containing protein [Candidatus Omnitrophota bacterium]